MKSIIRSLCLDYHEDIIILVNKLRFGGNWLLWYRNFNNKQSFISKHGKIAIGVPKKISAN